MRFSASAIVNLAAFALLVGSQAAAQEAGAWRSDGARAEIVNGGSAFAVTCVEVAAGRSALALVLEPAAGQDGMLPAADTLLLQISSRADAYVIAAGTDISTWFLPVAADPGGRLVSAAAPLDPVPSGDAGEAQQVAAIIANLRTGMNLVVGGDGFPRAERFTLRGSNRAIETAVEACRTGS